MLHVPAASSEQQPTTASAASPSGPSTKPTRQRAPKLDALLQVQQLLSGRFFIPNTEVDAFQAAHAIGTERLLEALIQPASLLAQTPVSSYNVGAAGLGGSGSIYIGVNLEFAGRPLNSSVHAEQFLVANAALHGERSLEVLAVSAAPCGHCRQFFCELPDAGSVRFIFGKGRGRRAVMTLERLLPLRFGPEDLSDDPSAPRMLQEQRDAPRLGPGDVVFHGGEAGAAGCQEMLTVALEELEKSYAPYTQCHSAVALRLKSGKVVGGRYLESAAYNPSFGPLQCAVVSATVSGMVNCSEIEEAMLVENRCGPMAHGEDVRQLLLRCNPHARLHLVHYQRKVARGRDPDQ